MAYDEIGRPSVRDPGGVVRPAQNTSRLIIGAISGVGEWDNPTDERTSGGDSTTRLAGIENDRNRAWFRTTLF